MNKNDYKSKVLSIINKSSASSSASTIKTTGKTDYKAKVLQIITSPKVSTPSATKVSTQKVTPVQKAQQTLLQQATSAVKSTVKKIADFTIKLVSPTIKSPIPLSDEERTKIATQKVTQPVSIKPNQTKLDEKQLGVIGQVKKTVSDINEKLGPVLEKYIYTPSEYQRQAIETGKKPKLTAGKVIGGAIEDAINAFLPVSGIGLKGTTEAVKLTTRLTEGLKTGTTFAGLTALIKAFKEEKIEPVDLLTSGGIGAWIGFSSPTVMKNISKDVEISARQSLEKFGFKSSDYKNIEALKSKFNKVAMKLHPDKGGNAKDFQNFVEAYNKMTSSGIEPTWKLPDIKEWVKNIWSNSKKSTSEKEIIKKQADEDFVNLVKSVIEKTKTEIQAGEKTPQQLIGEVIKSGQEKTPEGKELIKSAIEAQKSGQNVLVEKPPVQGGVGGEGKIVSPIVEKVSGGEVKKPVVKPKIVEVPKEQLPVGEGKLKVSKLEARMKGVIGKATEEQIKDLGLSTYKQMNKAEQITKASQYVVNNQQKALDVLQGKIEPPKGIIPESIYIAMTELAKDDITLATKLSSLSATALGQRISILSEINKDNPVRLLNEVYKVRAKAVEKKFGKDAKKNIVKSIKKQVKAPDKYDWSKFLDSLEC